MVGDSQAVGLQEDGKIYLLYFLNEAEPFDEYYVILKS